MAFWTVVVTQSRRENFAQELLERDGFATYLPRIGSPKHPAALFPGYLLVRVIVAWAPLAWTPGVLRILMAGDHPARLKEEIVADLKRREVRGFIKLPKNPNALAVGQPVRIMAGAFAGRLALYDGMTSEQRERVLLELLGQQVPVHLPVGQLSPVAIASDNKRV